MAITNIKRRTKSQDLLPTLFGVLSCALVVQAKAGKLSKAIILEIISLSIEKWS